MNQGMQFTVFAERVLGVRLTAAQRVCDAVAFDGVEPRALKGKDRDLCRKMYGDVETVPAVARAVVVRKKGRRSGDTYRSAMRALHLAVTHALDSLAPGEPAFVVFCAPDQRLSRIALQYVRGFLATVPALGALLERQNEDLIVLRRPDGRLVHFIALPASAGGSALRGRTILFFVLDEAAFFRSGETFEVNDVELYRAGAAGVLRGGQVFIPSTPYVEVGLLHDLFTTNHGRPTTALAAHCPTLLMRDDQQTRDVVARQRELDPEAARREFDAEFGTGEESLLRGDDVDAAIMGGVESLPRLSNGYYAMAGDLASGRAGRDFIVETVGHLEYEARDGAPPVLRLVVDVARDWTPKGFGRITQKVDLDQVERDMADASKHWRCPIHLDGWGFDLFQTRMKARGVRLIECGMAPGMQAKRARLLTGYFSQRKISIPDNPELVRQLKQIRVIRSSGGGVRFASANRKGHHDDYPKALMLLCEAVIKLQPSSLGDIEIEPARLIWHGAHSPLTCAVPRQYFKRVGNVRLSIAAPLGTPEHEEQQRERLARGIALPSDYDELGDARVAELMGFSPPGSLNRPVR